jgi:integrase
VAKRRGRGEGSITQRRDGRWIARVSGGWKDGKRQRKVICGATRKEVADQLPNVLIAAQEGAPFLDTRVTVGQFLTRWLAHKKTTMRPRAWATYEQATRLQLAPGLGAFALARLRPAHVQSWMDELHKAGTSARTIGYARRVLRAALNRARKWEMVKQNAAALSDPPRHIAKEIHPLTPPQARALLDAAKGHSIEPVISVATALGLRIGEALGLRWVDVKFAAGTLSVHQAIERSGGDSAARRSLTVVRRAIRAKIAAAPKRSAERRALAVELERLRVEWRKVRTQIVITVPKTPRSRRTIHMPAIVVTALKTHRTRQQVERLAAGGDWADSGLVFTSPLGTALDEGKLRTTYKALLETAVLPRIRFHDLRHTAATLLLAQGVDPRTIMETLGHSQISLTMNTYSHVLPTLQAEAARKMDAILAQ